MRDDLAIAFSIISITTGIFLNYGFGLAYWGPAAIWTWLRKGTAGVEPVEDLADPQARP